MDTFEELWNQYPRKVAKKAALLVWQRMSSNQKQSALQNLPLHLKYWEVCGTEKEYIPHLRTWLHEERWTDEVELPKPKQVEEAWWTNDNLIMAKAREKGISTVGKTRFELIDRIKAAA